MAAHRAVAVGVAALGATLAACVAVPALPPLEADVPAAWHNASAAGAAAAAPDLRGWWKALRDPLLDQLVDALVAENLGLAQARLRLQQARAGARRDGALYRPQLGMGGRPVQDAAAVDSYYHAGLEATWELSLFGEREAVDRIAAARVDQALAEGQSAQVAAVAELARHVLTLRAAQRDALALERLREIDSALVERTALQRRLGFGSAADAQASVESLAETDRARTAPPQTIAAAAQAIAALLGRHAPEAGWLGAGDGAEPAVDVFAFDRLPADLLRVRPDVRNAEAAVLQAAGEAGLARAALYPRISLEAAFVYSSNVTRNRRLSISNVFGIGPVIDVPLFDWGQRRAHADDQALALDAAVLGWRRAIVEAVAETETALSVLALERERGGLLAAAAMRAQDAADRQAARSRAGLAAPTERLLAQRRAIEAQRAESAQRYAAAQAVVQLYKALGGAPLFDGRAPANEARL